MRLKAIAHTAPTVYYSDWPAGSQSPAQHVNGDHSARSWAGAAALSGTEAMLGPLPAAQEQGAWTVQAGPADSDREPRGQHFWLHRPVCLCHGSALP